MLCQFVVLLDLLIPVLVASSLLQAARSRPASLRADTGVQASRRGSQRARFCSSSLCVEDMKRLRTKRLIKLRIIRGSQSKRNREALPELPEPLQAFRDRIFDDQVVTLEMMCDLQEACGIRI